MRHRRIIQIAATSENAHGTTERFATLFALADDGTVWRNGDPANTGPTGDAWTEVPELPAGFTRPE